MGSMQRLETPLCKELLLVSHTQLLMMKTQAGKHSSNQEIKQRYIYIMVSEREDMWLGKTIHFCSCIEP